MRDSIRNKEYFNEYIIETKSLIEDNDKYLKQGKVKEESIKWNRKSNFDYSFSLLVF